MATEKELAIKEGSHVILTGDRPTGKLHLGHYCGSLKQRVELQEAGDYQQFIMIADMQALTDNARNPEKIRQNLIEVALDYLAVGIDPTKSTIFIQSRIPQLTELTFYYMNLVTVSRLERNPTIKEEVKQRGFEKSIPVGFLAYPVSQAADITAFGAGIVPAGEDQAPIIEQVREIVRTFNTLYGPTLVEPEIRLPDAGICNRLPGIDGKAKMSKSLGNAIYLSDDEEAVAQKIKGMYTDPNHLRVEDPGDTEHNPVFMYLDAFAKDRATFEEMKDHYRRGGLGDVKVKSYLREVLEAELSPIRARRAELEQDIPGVYALLKAGSDRAELVAADTLERVRAAIGIEYFKDADLMGGRKG